jgi:hypothetical protein
MKEGKAMTTSHSPLRFPAESTHSAVKQNASKAADFVSMAQLLEEFIPRFKNEHERQFYREVVDAYRKAARDRLRQAGLPLPLAPTSASHKLQKALYCSYSLSKLP